ncbi:contactin-4-like [Glandiceps talaboti]
MVKMAWVKIAVVLTSVIACLADVDETPRGPHITREPEDTIFDQDSIVQSAYLECEADGYPRPTYSWYKDGRLINILDDTRLTLMEGILTITEPTSNVDKGNYQCYAENEFGIVISRVASLDFGFLDPFSTQAQAPRTATENLGFMLECKPPSAYPGLEIYWYKDVSTNFVRENERVMVANNGNLYFAKVEQSDAGNYHCVVKNILNPNSGAGQDLRYSPAVSLSVNTNTLSGYVQPAVFHSVQDQVVLEGDDVTLECFFKGSPVPRLSWRRIAPVGKSIPTSAVYDNRNQILLIRNIQLEDAGNYECTAESTPSGGGNPSRASSTGTIDVRAPPRWVKQLQDIEADIQGSAVFECEAEGTEPLKYTWYRNGEQLTNRPRHSFTNNFKRLNIINLVEAEDESDSAMYQCKAYNNLLNKERAIYSTGQLKVLALAPSFDKEPLAQNQPAPKNGDVIIECNPEAAPKPTFRWLHTVRGKDVEITASSHYEILENGHLKINNVQNSDGGKYTCIAENYLGDARSQGYLLIRDGTAITQWPLAKTISIGQETTLTCKATSDSLLDLTYIWLLDGFQLDFDDDSHYRRLKDGNLEIVKAELRQSGIYTCTAHTTIDEVSRSAELKIRGPPGPPAGVRPFDCTANSCQIRWSRGTDNNNAIKTYTVESRTDNDPEWKVERDNIPPGDSSAASLTASLNNLSPWSSYEFRVTATNDIGKGQPSWPSPPNTALTARDKPYDAPSNVGGGGGNVGDLRITWEPVLRQRQNAPGLGYYVYWKRTGKSGDFTKGVVTDDDVGEYTVKGVPTYVQYDVRVGTYNSEGDGPNSTIVVIHSHEAAPNDYPRDVYAEATSGSSIKVSWTKIDTTNLQGKLQGYKVMFWSTSLSESMASVRSSADTGTTFEIKDLEPETSYNIRVLAYSGGGNGPTSRDTVRAKTLKAAPLEAPVNVKAAVSSSTSVAVTWNRISTGGREEPLEGYKVLYYLDGLFESDASKVTVKGADSTKGTVDGLQPGRFYLVQVQGYSLGGDGVSSDPIKIGLYGAARQTSRAPSMHCFSFILLSMSLLLHIGRYLW